MGQSEGLKNAGKKEQRQFNQILNKAVKEGKFDEDGEAKEIEARTVPGKTHSGKHGSRK
jgi:hypothetical protein